MAERLLTSNIDARLAWDIRDTDKGIAIQTDEGDIQPEYNFVEGTGVGGIDLTWYSEFTVSGDSNHIIDLQSLPVTIFGMEVQRSFSNIKSLTIENLSQSSQLVVGSSGVSDSIDFLGYTSEIGYSGVICLNSLIGWDVDATHKNLSVYNPSLANIRCKILIEGVG